MSEVVSIPQLRFPEFRDEWRVDKFVDLCKFQQGVQVDVELQSTEPKNNFLRFLRIENYTQKSNDFRYIPKELSSNKSITENEIAIVRYGATAGYIGRGLKGVLANNLFKLVLNKDTLDTDYLFHLLRSYKTFCFFQSEMSGGAMPALSFGIVGALKLPYSSISEQQKIAAFLTVVDNKIEQLSKKQELLGEYKKGLMQQIFSQAIRFKADDGSDFPDWEEKRLGSVGQIVTGKTPSTNNPELWDGDISFITPTDITEQGKYQTKTQRTITKQRNTKLLPIGSIAYTCIASIGKMMITTNNSSTNQQINSIIVNDDFNNEFVYYALLKLTPYIKSTQANTTLPIINKTEFSGFKIQIPSLQEQTKIAIFLSSIDRKIEQVGKQLDESKQFKKALLQQMFV